MTKICFTNTKLELTEPTVKKIATIAFSDVGTVVTFYDDPESTILLTTNDITHLDFEVGSTVTIEPMSYPENMFSMTKVTVSEPKPKARNSPNSSSPMRADQISNSWNF